MHIFALAPPPPRRVGPRASSANVDNRVSYLASDKMCCFAIAKRRVEILFMVLLRLMLNLYSVPLNKFAKYFAGHPSLGGGGGACIGPGLCGTLMSVQSYFCNIIVCNNHVGSVQ